MTSLEPGAVTNGSLDQDSTATKRKHVQDPDLARSRNRQIQRDLLELLQRHDTVPSFLTHELGQDSAGRVDEPVHKKARLSSPTSSPFTIAARLETASYASLEQIKADATRVSQELISSIRAKAGETVQTGVGRPSVDELKQIHRIQTFEVLIRDVANKEMQHTSIHGAQDVAPKQEPDGPANGHVSGLEDRSTVSRTGAVLTLFGNAPTPKQLFSSMQHAMNARSQPLVKNELIVEEMSLPTGITATSVMTGLGDEAKKGPTFEEAFAPPHSLPTLQPPKSHKRSSTRDNIVTWEFKDPLQKNSRKGGYTVQGLTVGDWLNYGGLDPETDPSSPREKRKLRDRALSSGEHMQQRPSKATLEEASAREEEALFRRAFSSFAPSHDNAKALIPEETKNMVWWHKVGNRRFNSTFALDPALVDETPVTTADFNIPAGYDPSSEDFSHILEDLDEFDGIELDEPEQVHSKTDIDEVLREISDLLETLASYQRIRNASLISSTSTTRTPISPSPTLASKIGKPDEPAVEEISTYAKLRRELAYLILKLPPYAIAKLNGDQLADLAVNRIIPLESKDVRGTLEEDQVSRQAKLAAMATASSIATLTRPSSSAGQHYNTTAQRTPAIGQAANTRYGQSAQYGPRTPAIPQYQRSASGHQQYSTPAAPRPTYTQPSQYSRTAVPQPGYGPAASQQYYQPRPPQPTPGSYTGYNTQYHQTPQQRPGYPTQPPIQYQQRSHAAAANAVAYQTANTAQQGLQNRAASPAKSTNYAAPTPQSQTQQRPGYNSQNPQPSSGRGTPTQYASQSQTPVNGYQPPPQQQSQQAVAPRPASATPQPTSTVPPPAQEISSSKVNGHA